MISAQRLNMRRGLLRVWIVVSTIWVLFISVTSWSQLSGIFVAIEPPAGQGAMVLSPGPYACWAARHSDNPFAFINNGAGPTSPAEAWRQCIAYKMQMPEHALAPPLTLLGLGYAVAWVMKGFRKM
jgi:hypothetical protein